VPIAIALFLSISMPVSGLDHADAAEERQISLVKAISHDPEAFTQGLEDYDGVTIFESTGLYGHSRLREINLSNGEVVREVSIDESLFGEGITIYGETVIMLTWKAGKAFVFDLSDLSIKGNFTYEGEGWGLCFDGHSLVMSNGTSEISFLDPDTFEKRRTILVTWDGQAVDRLNELECVGGTIYANIWGQDHILAINSSSGVTEFFVSATSLSESQGRNSNEVLNGIAFDQTSGGFWITGKNWTQIYLVSFEPTDVPFSDGDTEALVAIPESYQFGIILAFSILGLSLARYYSREYNRPPGTERQQQPLPAEGPPKE
jgi:glutaminyl-peptide cyclotransferase